jgi:hemerythrin-like domain-containing protein
VPVDPVALLEREHGMILNQLRMIETAVASGVKQGRALAQPHRDTLRDLLLFFTDRVGVHFDRESVLISALTRSIGHKREECGQLQGLQDEHRELKADATAIIKKLDGKAVSLTSAERADPFGIKTFVRQYKAHLSCEERILYVLAGMRLTNEQKQRVCRRMLQV